MKSEDCHDFLINKLWENYKNIDDRRRRAFYYLYYAIIIFGIIALAPISNGKIITFGLEVEYYLAILLGPSVILILFNSYVYLCAHSFISSICYFNELKKKNYNDFINLGFSFGRLSNTLKIRDITENLNIFKFPLIESSEWDSSLSKLYKILSRLLVNLIILLTLIIPFGIYGYYTIWFNRFDMNQMCINICHTLHIFYYVMGSSFILTPLYFFCRVKPFRIIQRSTYLTENIDFKRGIKTK
jgi:hypothetical protein